MVSVLRSGNVKDTEGASGCDVIVSMVHNVMLLIQYAPRTAESLSGKNKQASMCGELCVQEERVRGITRGSQAATARLDKTR